MMIRSLRLKNVTLAFIILNLCSCVTVTPITGPDGSTNQLVSGYSVEACYKRAREVCRGDYSIINSSTDTSSAQQNSSTTTNLLVKCAR